MIDIRFADMQDTTDYNRSKDVRFVSSDRYKTGSYFLKKNVKLKHDAGPTPHKVQSLELGIITDHYNSITASRIKHTQTKINKRFRKSIRNKKGILHKIMQDHDLIFIQYIY